MSRVLIKSLPSLNYAVIQFRPAGVDHSGDLHLVRPTVRGALLAVLDAAGTGSEAAQSAHLAVAVVEAHIEDGVISIIRSCHEELSDTRGALISLASLDEIEGTITWTGVGNIAGVLLRDQVSTQYRDAAIPLYPGVVGFRLPPFQATVTPITPGDLLILATDSIRSDFVRTFCADDEPGAIAEYLASNFRKREDSGLVLVARYLGLKK